MIDLDVLQKETEKLLSLLQDRHQGLSSWNELLREQLETMAEMAKKAGVCQSNMWEWRYNAPSPEPAKTLKYKTIEEYEEAVMGVTSGAFKNGWNAARLATE
jgi:hypothetical protein